MQASQPSRPRGGDARSAAGGVRSLPRAGREHPGERLRGRAVRRGAVGTGRYRGAESQRAGRQRSGRRRIWRHRRRPWRAFRAGRLDAGSRNAIVAAEQAGIAPLQDTALGGEIGIHGIGRGDPRIHRAFNWTAGCVALTNAQLQDFGSYAYPGMRVEIR